MPALYSPQPGNSSKIFAGRSSVSQSYQAGYTYEMKKRMRMWEPNQSIQITICYLGGGSGLFLK